MNGVYKEQIINEEANRLIISVVAKPVLITVKSKLSIELDLNAPFMHLNFTNSHYALSIILDCEIAKVAGMNKVGANIRN